MPVRVLISTLCLSLLLQGCAGIPEDFEQVPSNAWQHPETTTLGAFFDAHEPAGTDLSGVVLIAHPQQAFRARYAFAGQAEKTLDMQYYLWKGDTTGRLLFHKVFQAADRGVQVRLMIDDIYHSGRDVAYAAIDQHPNVQVRVFNPMGNRGLAKQANFMVHKSKLNHRMHNKIFLADNAVAVLGGRNIGDDYFGMDPELNFLDLDVLAVGAAARDAGKAYDLYWNSTKAVPILALLDKPPKPEALADLREELEATLFEALDKLPYRVPLKDHELEEALTALAKQLIWAETEIIVDPLDRFDGDEVSAFVVLGKRLGNAMQREIVIQTAYLIPTTEGIEEIRALTERGMRVRLMTNSMQSNNHLSVHAQYMKYRKKLIEAGAELYELKADNALMEFYKQSESRVAESHAGMHTKSFVVDDNISMIGSYNMDPRSRIWNSEIGLLITSKAFADTVLQVMGQDFEPQNAYRLTLNEKGKLIWTAEGASGTQVWTRDPGAPWWRRALARMISWLPIENEL